MYKNQTYNTITDVFKCHIKLQPSCGWRRDDCENETSEIKIANNLPRYQSNYLETKAHSDTTLRKGRFLKVF